MLVRFLGTGGVAPSDKRRLPCYLIEHAGYQIILDIGEGAQYRLLRYGTNKNLMILLSHLHADHVLGLPGFLATLAMTGRTRPVYIVGPPGTRNFVLSFISLPIAFFGDFPIYVIEAVQGDVISFGDLLISVALGKHTITNYAYRVDLPRRPKLIKELIEEVPKEKRRLIAEGELVEVSGRLIKPREVSVWREGKSVVYTGDTRPTLSIIELSRNADLLIHDSTYTSEYRELAIERGHSTAQEAAEVALIAGVKSLALVHISRRCDEEEILKEAREVFENSFVPKDLDRREIRMRFILPALSSTSAHSRGM